ncbi:MAG: fumarylacetoacetase, partial [Rubrivivax sp.]
GLRGDADLQLDVQPALRAAGMPPHVISRPRFRDQYWTAFQMLVHQASNGCRILPGDLLGSGTISGPNPDELGCLLEITRAGKVGFELPTGERRVYLEDGDEITLAARCEREGFVSIGFGSCTGTVLPAIA